MEPRAEGHRGCPSPQAASVRGGGSGGRDAFSVAFFVRMVFSCLVDADFLDTERFMNPERAAARPTWPADVLERMEASLDAYMSSQCPPPWASRSPGKPSIVG